MGARLTRALSRIPDEFVGQPFYQAFMTSIVARLEESDQILADLATMRWIDTAEGVWLDTVGEIVGIPRFYEPITEGIFTYNGLGPDLVVDGDMEAPNTDAWPPLQDADITKQPDFQDPTNQVLQIKALGPSTSPRAKQILGEIGKRYVCTGRGRSLGGPDPFVRIGGGAGSFWLGLDIPTWQSFIFYSTALASARIELLALSAAVGESCEFDDITVREIPPGDPDLGYSGLPAPGAGGIYNSVNGLFSDTLIDDDTYRRYIKAKAVATGTPGTLTDIYTFVKDAFEVESIVTTSGTRAVTVELLEALTQGQKLQLKRWAPLSAAVSIRVIGP